MNSQEHLEEATNAQVLDTLLDAITEIQKIQPKVNAEQQRRREELADRVMLYRVEIRKRLEKGDEATRTVIALREQWLIVSRRMNDEIARLQMALRGVVGAFDQGQPVDVDALQEAIDASARALSGDIPGKP